MRFTLLAVSFCLYTLVTSVSILHERAAQNESAKPPFRAMIVGDSLSHGRDGDYTWRYRLWQWLRSASSNVTPHFVGPLKGTWLDNHDPDDFFHAGGRYAEDVDSEFLEAPFHAAVWGRPLSWSERTIEEWVAAHQPDWLLLLMGYNDLAWIGDTPEITLGFMESFISKARSVRPDLRFLVGNLPDQDKSVNVLKATRAYNRQLRGLMTRLDEPGSLVRLVDVNRGYDCRPDQCPDG